MTLLAALCGVGIAGAIWLIIPGVRPAERSAAVARPNLGRKAFAALAPIDARRVGLAAAGALAALVVVRWPVAAVAGATAGWFAPLPGQGAARRQADAKTEAIAQWCEMLRDTAGTARGIEGMLAATARSAPGPIRDDVARMARRLETEPLEAALDGLADDLSHPIGDMVVVALGLAASAGSRRVRSVLDQLATAANRTAGMRRRVDAARARPRAATRLVALIVACFVTGMLLFARDYLAPYGSATGQLVLLGIGIYWSLGFWWMSRMGQLPDVRRFISASGTSVGREADLGTGT